MVVVLLILCDIGIKFKPFLHEGFIKIMELNGLRPVDNRPSTDYLHRFVNIHRRHKT